MTINRDLADLAQDATTVPTSSTDLASLSIDNHDSIVVDSNGHQINAEQSAFLVRSGVTQSNVTGNGTSAIVVQGTTIFDQNSDHDGVSTFTAPVAGRYLLGASFQLSGIISSHTRMILDIVTSNRNYELFHSNPYAVVYNGYITPGTASILADMDAADTATVRVRVFNGTKVVEIDFNAAETYNRFFGALIC